MGAVVHRKAVARKAVASLGHFIKRGVEWDLGAETAKADLFEKKQVVIRDADADTMR
jgi:hypothetical protein